MQTHAWSAVGPLLALIDEAFDHHAWHGTNLRGSIRGLTAAHAAWRPARGRHNAWELVVHAAYWKYTVRRRLTGEKRGSFALPGSDWFTRPQGAARGRALEAAWKRDVALLVDEHRRLREVLARLPAAALDRKAPGSRTRIGVLVRGIASHDLYHAGQIQLLKRLYRR
jgi:DinB family protein